MTLTLSPDQLQQILTQAEQAYPEECCGMLIGVWDGRDDRSVIKVWPTVNAWGAEAAEALDSITDPASVASQENLTKTRRYWIDPQEILAAQRYARDLGETAGRQVDLIGIYHSHPDHPAVPSECDRAVAWPQYSYVIVSVQQGQAQEYRCWSLNPEHQFQPEPMLIADESY